METTYGRYLLFHSHCLIVQVETICSVDEHSSLLSLCKEDHLDCFQVSAGDATLLLAHGKAWMFIDVYVSGTQKKRQRCLVA